MCESKPHSRAIASDMTVVEAPVSTQARRRLCVCVCVCVNIGKQIQMKWDMNTLSRPFLD